jgi:VanZ family protein
LAKIKSTYLYYTPAIVWGILIFYFSLMPGGEVPDLLKSIQGFFIHMAIYFLLALLIICGASQFTLSKVGTSIFTFTLLIILVMGGILEPIQELYIPNRVGELEDVIANMLGGVIAVFLWRTLVKN